MAISERRDDYISQIKKWHPEYLVETFFNMSDKQLYASYKGIQKKRQELERQLYSLMYEGLADINLTKQEIANLSSKSLEQIIAHNNGHPFTQNNIQIPEEYDEIEFFSHEELYQILGDEPTSFSPQTLLNKGYSIEPGSEMDYHRYEREQKIRHELKNKIINLLIETHIIPKFELNKENIKKLQSLPLEKLINLYEEYKESLESLPEVSEIKLELEKIINKSY